MGGICQWSSNDSIDGKLVAVEARSNEGGRRATLGLVRLIGISFF